jgi:hypothetical protein
VSSDGATRPPAAPHRKQRDCALKVGAAADLDAMRLFLSDKILKPVFRECCPQRQM